MSSGEILDRLSELESRSRISRRLRELVEMGILVAVREREGTFYIIRDKYKEISKTLKEIITR
jgi:DNA-binding transcriptional ArsR family regulator